MCVFSMSTPRHAVEVGDTHIFARMDASGHQWLAYEMSLHTPEDTAMVLPVPIASGGDDSFRFVSLEGYPTLFDDLTRAIHVWSGRQFIRTLGLGGPALADRLPVHQVGAYEASFVPDQAAFARLDERFRLSPEIWRQLPDYGDWAFAVFKLASSGTQKAERVHAMAFCFAARDRDALFFPTVHVHDGHWQAFAQFDHILYVQGNGFDLPTERLFVGGRETSWDAIQNDYELFEDAVRSERHDGRVLGRFGRVHPADYGVVAGGAPLVQVAQSRGVVDADEPITAVGLSGRLPNTDTWIRRGGGKTLPLRTAKIPESRRPHSVLDIGNIEIV